LFGIDPRPHNVGVPASVLFVDDDRAGLILKAERTLRAFSRTSPSRATASAGTRKASSSDALSTRPWHLKTSGHRSHPKSPVPTAFCREQSLGSLTGSRGSCLVPRPVQASASRDCPADASRNVETYYSRQARSRSS
jgi:hypothetical protein